MLTEYVGEPVGIPKDQKAGSWRPRHGDKHGSRARGGAPLHSSRWDEVFRYLVLARIIEPVSKLDSLRVVEEAGVTAASYRTLKRRLPAYA